MISALSPNFSTLTHYLDDFKEELLLLTIAAAVTAATAALFMGATFAAIGYALFGLSAYLHYVQIQDGADEARLGQLTTQINTANSQIQALTDENKSFSTKLATQEALLQNQQEILGKQESQLQVGNEKLKATLADYKIVQARMQEDIDKLGQEKAALANTVADLNTAYAAIQKAVSQSLTQNLALGKQMGVFQGKEDELTTLIGKLQQGPQNIQEFASQIEAGLKSSQDMVQSLASELKRLQGDLEKLGSELEQFRSKETDLKTLADRFHADEAGLESNNLLTKRNQELQDSIAAFTQQNGLLEEQNAKLALTIQDQQGISEKVHAAVESATNKLAELGTACDLRMKEITILDKKIADQLSQPEHHWD